MKTTRLLTLFFGLFLPLVSIAQEKVTVSGTVSEAGGVPVIGAGVVEKGTQNGTVTDLDGHYRIMVPAGSIIEISCIGFTSQEFIASEGVYDITMEEDARLLDEVVVVGYGVQKKSNLTGSISSVKTIDLESRGVTNISSALQGKVSGVQSYSASAAPGSAPSIQVRGIASNSSSAPLYVIDGRIAAGPGEINQNDIESIEILKDGASAAIYGASAGNGVILITTRKGAGKGTVTYEYQVASQSLAYKPNVLSAQEFADWYTDAGVLSLTTLYNNWDGVTDTDWLDVTFGNSLMQKHNIRFQGGNQSGQFYTSLSYLDDDGMVVGDKDVHRALTGMINTSYKINRWLEVGTNNVIEYAITRSVPSGGETDNLFASAIGMSPLVKPVYTLDEMSPQMLSIYNNPDTYGKLLDDGNGGFYGFAPYTSTNRTNPLILRDIVLSGFRLTQMGISY